MDEWTEKYELDKVSCFIKFRLFHPTLEPIISQSVTQSTSLLSPARVLEDRATERARTACCVRRRRATHRPEAPFPSSAEGEAPTAARAPARHRHQHRSNQPANQPTTRRTDGRWFPSQPPPADRPTTDRPASPVRSPPDLLLLLLLWYTVGAKLNHDDDGPVGGCR